MRVNFSNNLGVSSSGGAGQSHEIYVTETTEYVVASDCCSRKANNEQGTSAVLMRLPCGVVMLP